MNVAHRGTQILFRFEDHVAFYQVFKFSNVSRPRIFHQIRQEAFRERGRRTSQPPAMDAQKVVSQDRNIVSSLSERWDVNRQDANPVEEILTKITRLHLSFQKPIRSANKSNIYSPVASSANPIELAILKQVKQFYLNGRVQVTDLVQKECAAVSKLYATGLRTISASESAFFIAEEL